MLASCLTVGPLAENCWVVRADAEASEAVVVDPGDEAPRILALLDELGVTAAGILVTHAHFDHVGAVAPVAEATGAEVWCPALEAGWLADIDGTTTWPGAGPFTSHEAEHLLEGGESLTLVGLTFDVLHLPGHSPGHLAYVARGRDAVLSGDVLFEGSVGRTDLAGSDPAALGRSLGELVRVLAPTTRVLPGHMGQTTIGRELRDNPFLQRLGESA